MFVTALVAAVLAGAALTVVLLTGGGPGTSEDPTGAGSSPTGRVGGHLSPSPGEADPPGESPAGSSDGSAAGDGELDECVVGRWRVVESTQGSTIGVVFTQDGTGPVFEFGTDGTGHADYDPGVTYASEVLGETTTMVVTGRLDYVYVTRDGRLQFTRTESAARVRFETVFPLEEQYDLSTTPVDYTCAGDTLDLTDPDRDFAATYHRLD